MLTEDPTLEQPYAAARRLVVRIAEILYERRMTELIGGNMSVRVDDAVVTTPTRASDFFGWRLDPGDALVLDLDGDVVEGDPDRISREAPIHTRLYRAYPEVGSVLHLHLAEALSAAWSGRWEPGVVADTTDRFGAAICLLEPGYSAQTEPHDARVTELLGAVPREEGAISISPGHGLFMVARDWSTAIRAADTFRQRLQYERCRARLRAAHEASLA
jgi:ribulose-5-phosphate 4-epimerase/fuculose-1-phosphate aldolase